MDQKWWSHCWFWLLIRVTEEETEEDVHNYIIIILNYFGFVAGNGFLLINKQTSLRNLIWIAYDK